jgi:hypothetical protein
MYHPRAMALAQRPLADGDLDQMWEIEREAFNADPVNLEWWKKCERAIGLERLEGLFLVPSRGRQGARLLRL